MPCRRAGFHLFRDTGRACGNRGGLGWASLGWGPVEGDWSLLTASAHKWGGPSGVGLLVVRKGARFVSQGPADERESGRAAGFENLPGIVAAAASLRAVRAEAEQEAVRLR